MNVLLQGHGRNLIAVAASKAVACPHSFEFSAGVRSGSAHGVSGLTQQQALIRITGTTTIPNMMRTICRFSRPVSISPAAALGSSVILCTNLSELFPKSADALRVVSLRTKPALAIAALAEPGSFRRLGEGPSPVGK